MAVIPLSPPRSRHSATLEEIGRSMGEGVDLVVGGLKQPCVFDCFLGWEFWRRTVPISDSTLVALVESPVSPVFSSSSSTTTGSSGTRQKIYRVQVRDAMKGTP